MVLRIDEDCCFDGDGGGEDILGRRLTTSVGSSARGCNTENMMVAHLEVDGCFHALGLGLIEVPTAAARPM